MMMMETDDDFVGERESMCGIEISVSKPDTLMIPSYESDGTDTTLMSESSQQTVHFSDVFDVIPPNPLSFVRKEMWYSCRELMNFKSEVKQVCRELRASDEAMLNAHSKVCSLSFSEETRGLETKACFERQRRRYIATKYIVKAQFQLSPDLLAAKAQHCNRWAAKLAQQEAHHDSIKAYLVHHEGSVRWDEQHKRIIHYEGPSSMPFSAIDQNQSDTSMMSDLTLSSSRRVRRRISNSSFECNDALDDDDDASL